MIDYNEIDLLCTSIRHDILTNKLTLNQQNFLKQQMNENQLKVAIALLRSYSLDEFGQYNEGSYSPDRMFETLLKNIKSAMFETSYLF